MAQREYLHTAPDDLSKNINQHAADQLSEGFCFEPCLFVLVGREKRGERMTRRLEIQSSDVSTFTAGINTVHPGMTLGTGCSRTGTPSSDCTFKASEPSARSQ